jgi:NitT/TauT family transport system substrate-binding protein
MKHILTRVPHTLFFIILLSFLMTACGGSSTSGSNGGQTTVHLGYFPNLTHAVALVGVARNTFQQDLGSNVKLDTKTFNAGPSLIEALFAGSIDIGYVGPSPAINGYVKSKGAALKIIAGASSGGVLFVVRPGANIKTPQDLNGKKLADPQLGGTQDVSLRNYLRTQNLKTTDQGGSVQVLPTDNATILTEFKQGQIDGAWVPEPYASRLVTEDKGTVFLDERSLWPGNKFVTTNVIVSTKFMDAHPDLVTKFLQAHVDTVQYINNNLSSAESLVNAQLKALTGKALKTSTIASAFKDLTLTYDPLQSTALTAADNAFQLGYLGKSKPDLSGLYNLAPLNSVLSAKGLPQIASGS